MTTAFELSRPEHDGRYDVTVYQMGFRLGGKGASGRGEAGRIEEHGLHLWMGFYENAFALMRETYGRLGRDPSVCPIATWRDAFEPAPHVAVVDRTPNGKWDPWIAHFPAGRGLPGDAPDAWGPFSVAGYLRQAATLLVELLRSAHEKSGGPPLPSLNAWPSDPATVIGAVHTLLRYGQLATAAALFEATDLLRVLLEMWRPGPYRQGGIVLPLLDAIADATRRNLQSLVYGDGELSRIWHVVDLIIAIIRGSTLHGLALDPRGFDAINEYEWLEWLRMHGASEASLQSGFVRGIYDLVFAYEGGDTSRPRLAAGVALRGSMRMFFTYRGALFWRMTAGMGDIVFAPMYELMRRRGVKFAFFHRLEHMGLGPESPGELPHIGSLKFAVQAHTVGDADYEPLVDVHGVPSFPSEPDWSQLVDGERLRDEGIRFETPFESRIAEEKELLVGRDFDMVVLGLGVAAIPYVAGDLLRREPKWSRMMNSAQTAATQSVQLWMNEDMEQLGWEGPQVNLSGYVVPYDTWADMRHLLKYEDWGDRAKALAYFVSVLPDTMDPREIVDESYHDAQHEQVRKNAIAFLNRHIGPLWPKAVAPDGSFRWEVLSAAAEDGSEGSDRFGTQFWMSNVNPTDRYSLSVPGSIQHRLSPLDLSFDNLTITGDWTQSGLDSGCVESAVMSGLLAAHAISGYPALESIVGYDHP